MPVTCIPTSLAMCDGEVEGSACGILYPFDEIKRRDGTKGKFSGGSCKSPNLCQGCNDGFYSDGPYCLSKC